MLIALIAEQLLLLLLKLVCRDDTLVKQLLVLEDAVRIVLLWERGICENRGDKDTKRPEKEAECKVGRVIQSSVFCDFSRNASADRVDRQ